MCPVYLGLPKMAYTVWAVHPRPGRGGGYRPGSAFSRAAMVGMPSLWTTRQVKICSTTGARAGSRARRVLVRPWLALTGTGCGMRTAVNP